MSYHKKHREWFYKIPELVFYKCPIYGRFQHTFIPDMFYYNQDIPKTYKLGYVDYHENNIFSDKWRDIKILEKILKRVY